MSSTATHLNRPTAMRSLALLFVAAAMADGQSNLPPIGTLPAPVAVSPHDYRSVAIVRTLPNGTMFVNDASRTARRLYLMDTTFRVIKVVADTLPDTPVQYGLLPVAVLPYLGDSTLFVETMTPEMYVLDAAGNVGRRLAVPNPRDAGWLPQTPIGAWASTDSKGRILYRSQSPRPPELPPGKPGDQQRVVFPDSAPILRADIATRQVETLAWYHIRKLEMIRVVSAVPPTINYAVNDPTLSADDFVVLSDRTLVIVRADLHLDLVGDDGSIKSSPRIPYPWKRLSDSDKVALMDSIRKASADRAASGPPASAGGGTSGGIGAGGGMSAPPGLGGPPPDFAYAKPEALGDYLPAFGLGSVAAGPKGTIWIKTHQSSPSPNTSVYDVVTRDGKLLARYEIANDRTIVGFDAGSLYLTGRDATGAFLERVKVP